jgi:DNA-binding XRE family transcriptional regulator
MLQSLLDRGRPIPIPPPTPSEDKDVHWVEPRPEIVVPILLRQAREAQHLTLEQLAARLGVTYQAVQKLERPGANPSIKTLAKVARALGRELEIALRMKDEVGGR